jgi:cyclic di-GMP phosphodiesterase
MRSNGNKTVGYGATRRSRRSARARSGESWYDLLKPLLEPANRPALMRSDFAPNETEEILFALALAVEQRDRQTAGHCARLALMAVSIGVAMGLARASLTALYRGGYLHDVGKVGIPDSILFKPDKLTADEWVTMRSHTTRGEEICRPMKSLSCVLPIIRHHHERWDGSGYPDGLRGEQIPLLARVLQVADIYDALTSPRPYKPAYTPDRALEIIAQETDRGWRDPQIVSLFFRLHKDVLSRLTGCRPDGGDDHLESMRESLLNLQRYLEAADMRPDVGSAVRLRG